MFAYQKAKCKYFINSDRNTRLFHSIIRRNAKRNYIPAVTKRDGEITNNMDEVVGEFLSYYQELLGSEVGTDTIDENILSQGPMLPLDSWEDLIRVPNDEEIKKALFHIGNDKAPGPDGYSSGFFKKSWDIVGADVCRAVKEFFVSGQIIRQLNHTIIALILKSPHASSVGDYRPISCCNVAYKIISKILALRLEGVLPKIIDEAQSAFVRGRSMLENIHLAQELT